MPEVSCLEICAGAGGQALGLEWAGFTPQALVEIDKACCNTLRFNRPQWNVIEGDLRQFEGTAFKGIDLLAGGVPCSPFSKAGKQFTGKKTPAYRQVGNAFPPPVACAVALEMFNCVKL